MRYFIKYAEILPVAGPHSTVGSESDCESRGRWFEFGPNFATIKDSYILEQCDLGPHCLPRPVCPNILDHYGMFEYHK